MMPRRPRGQRNYPRLQIRTVAGLLVGKGDRLSRHQAGQKPAWRVIATKLVTQVNQYAPDALPPRHAAAPADYDVGEVAAAGAHSLHGIRCVPSPDAGVGRRCEQEHARDGFRLGESQEAVPDAGEAGH